jgi:hypothetical protein
MTTPTQEALAALESLRSEITAWGDAQNSGGYYAGQGDLASARNALGRQGIAWTRVESLLATIRAALEEIERDAERYRGRPRGRGRVR